MTSKRLGGVIAAVPTPVTENGEPDTARFLRHAEWALDNGCHALNVLGTTGEANSFSARQRMALMEAAASAIDRARLMVGTGTPDLETTIALTRRAHDLALPPRSFCHPTTTRASTTTACSPGLSALSQPHPATPFPSISTISRR